MLFLATGGLWRRTIPFVIPGVCPNRRVQVVLLEEVQEDPVLSCRFRYGAFSLALARLTENGENRMLMSPITSARFQLHTLN